VRPLLLLAAAGAALSLAACSGGDGEDAGGPTTSTSSPPATSTQPETTTDPPTTQPEPARPLRLERVAAGLESPLYLTAAPGEPSRLYVVLQAGRIVVLEAGRVRSRPFLDITDEVVAGGEQGLLSAAFHPEYGRNRRLYVNYTNLDGDTRVVEYRANGERTAVDESSARVLLAVDQPYPNHNGGQLQFGPDGKLWVGMGDGGSGGDPENRAQDLSERLGKLLTIDVDRPEPHFEIGAYGLRNPWRFSFDRETGDLWIGDVGQGDFEEIDYLPRDRIGRLANFGWDAFEGRARYEDKEPNPAGRLVAPVAVYDRSQGISVTGGYVYRGGEVHGAVGRYFYGDYGSGAIWSLPTSGGGRPRQERFEVEALASFGEDATGELFLVSLNGSIFRLTDRRP
jgi:glucose/arabinose dehydrogenase